MESHRRKKRLLKTYRNVLIINVYCKFLVDEKDYPLFVHSIPEILSCFRHFSLMNVQDGAADFLKR